MIVIRAERERRKKHLSLFETRGIDHAKRVITIAKICVGAARRVKPPLQTGKIALDIPLTA
jgi:hypothetical protein